MPKDDTIVLPKYRAQRLEALRNLKMAESAHAFVRGNTVQFYEWLERSERSLPQGPDIWICGDCHVSNIGPIADAKGHIEVLIRDLDQTVIGNPVHDIIRLGVSLATAARGSDLSGVVTTQMTEQLLLGYELAMSPPPRKSSRRVPMPDTVRLVMKKAFRRRWKDLAKERIEGTAPDIPLSRKYWPITKSERAELAALVQTDDMRHLVTGLIHRDSGDPIEMLDAAYWVKGCSSLGRLRYAVLLRVGEGNDEGSFCLIDVKEALRAAAPRSKERPIPRDNARRVIEGAIHLAPHLGKRMMEARIQGKPVFIRELRPQDLKIDLESLTQTEAMDVARYLGNVVGEAHARQMTKEQCKAWLAELGRNRPKSIDVPSWLWRSVVELVQAHEGGYLDHCRRFASAYAAHAAS